MKLETEHRKRHMNEYGTNSYSYCVNNPVMYHDPSGYADEKCGTDSKKKDGDSDAENYYRTMSQYDYDYLRMTGELPVTKETFVSPTKSFSDAYDGVTVEFSLKLGTTQSLYDIGVGNNSKQALADFGTMPQVFKGWTENNAYFKGEGNQTNIGLGQGRALEIFNTNIISFKPVGGN